MTTTKYRIVEFTDGIEMIPINWFNVDNTKAYWPPYKNQIHINKAIAKMECPNEETWVEYDVNKILGQAESYNAAIEKLKLAQDISDIDAVSEEQYKKSRHDRAKAKKVVDSESSDDSANQRKQISKTLPMFPKVPNLISPAKSSKPVITNVTITHKPKQSDNYSSSVENKYLATKKNIKRDKIQNEIMIPITRVPSRLTEQTKFMPQINVLSNITNVEHTLENKSSDYLEEDIESGLKNSATSIISNNAQVSLDSNKEIYSLTKIKKNIEVTEGETSQIEAYMQEIIFLLNKVLINQAEIKKSLITQTSNTDLPAESDNKAIDFLQLTNSLPLKNEDELQQFEKQLYKESFKLRLINYLKCLGGKNDHDRVITIMKKIITNEFAMQYSYTGFKKKKSFQKLGIARCIIHVIAITTKKNTTAKEVSEWISKWLAGAKQSFDRETSKVMEEQIEDDFEKISY